MMGQQWCKVASNLDTNAKIRRAGRNGREVFLFALRRNAEPGNPRPGSIPATDLEPWFVADLLMIPESDASDGLSCAISAGLLERNGFVFVIVGWNEDEWGRGRFLSDMRRLATKRHNPSTSCEKPTDSPIERALWDALQVPQPLVSVTFCAGSGMRYDANSRSICDVGEPITRTPNTTSSHLANVYRHVRIGRYTADMIVTYLKRSPEARSAIVAVECDGRDFHERTADQFAHDRARDRALLMLGIPTMRFSGSEIAMDAARCAQSVWSLVCGAIDG